MRKLNAEDNAGNARQYGVYFQLYSHTNKQKKKNELTNSRDEKSLNFFGILLKREKQLKRIYHNPRGEKPRIIVLTTSI